MNSEQKMDWRTGLPVAYEERNTVREFVPPLSLPGLIELRARKLSASAVLLVLEAFRRSVTKQGAVVLSSATATKLKLTKKEVRTATRQLQQNAPDLTSITGEGRRARKLELTEKGIGILRHRT